MVHSQHCILSPLKVPSPYKNSPRRNLTQTEHTWGQKVQQPWPPSTLMLMAPTCDPPTQAVCHWHNSFPVDAKPTPYPSFRSFPEDSTVRHPWKQDRSNRLQRRTKNAEQKMKKKRYWSDAFLKPLHPPHMAANLEPPASNFTITAGQLYLVTNTGRTYFVASNGGDGCPC